MNTGSNCCVKTLGFFSVVTVALVFLSISGCGASEQQPKEETGRKAQGTEAVQIAAPNSKAFVGPGPTSLGGISIGMSKAEYVSALGINPIDCNIYKDTKGNLNRSELKFISPNNKTLCWGISSDFKKKGSIENVQIGGLSYDVIQASKYSSALVDTVGYHSKAIFLNDSLISLEIAFPNAGLEILTAKYGEPKLVDNRKIEVCKNRIGNEFKNEVGELDSIWINGEIRAVYRATALAPSETCTDGMTIQYYILEVPNQLKLIENSINEYRSDISKKEAKDSPF